MTALRLESPHEVRYRTKGREVLRREFVVTDADIEEILTLNPKFGETQRIQDAHRTRTVFDLQVFRCRLYEQFGGQTFRRRSSTSISMNATHPPTGTGTP